MALTELPQPPEVHRFPQCKIVDVVRWLPPISALHRHAVLACINRKPPYLASVEIHSLNPEIQPKELTHVATWESPSRISCLKTTQFRSRPIVVASTEEGSLFFLGASEDGAIIELDVATGIHAGLILGVDVVDSGEDCVSVGKDGRVNLVAIGDAGIITSRFFKSEELDVYYDAVKWASHSEFATGGQGFGLQWWDKRRPEGRGPVSQFKNNWAQGVASERICSMDILPSQKHTCLAGGSSGYVFVWDLRWPKQAVVLSGAEIGSDVWEVQFDRYDRRRRSISSSSSSSSSHILPPVVMGSDDGILAVTEQATQSVELMSEPYAINSFDIDKQNPSEIICSFHRFGVAIVSRP